MKNILVSVEKNSLVFSKYIKDVDTEDLNKTNVIDIKNLKFTEQYIIDNIELVSMYFNCIIVKFEINKAIIKSLDIAPTVLILIKRLTKINYISFSEDKELTYTISSLLLENNNLEKIDCYSLPNIMFYRFAKDQIETRSEILSTSKFLVWNKIHTYSDLFNKERIVIEEELNESDLPALIHFLDNNKNLKKVELKKYSRKNLLGIIYHLNQNNLRRVNILIYEDKETTNDIISDMKLFDKLIKKYNVNIKIKYSKEYKQKNEIKELNIVMLKYILIICLIAGIGLFIAYKLLEKKDMDNIEKNIEKIEKNITDNLVGSDNLEIGDLEDSNSTNSYYQSYSKVYNELKSINSDTIGWISVANTKVNYPVVQTTDNEYYLNHAFDKSKNIAGWIYVDYRNNMDNISKNTIIYGHSIKNGTIMFSSLIKTLNSNWYNNEENLNINFSIKGQDVNWKIFSIYTIEKTNDYLYTDFSTDDEYFSFINKLQSRSIKNFDSHINKDSKILTLSTCYKDDSQRLVIHAYMN